MIAEMIILPSKTDYKSLKDYLDKQDFITDYKIDKTGGIKIVLKNGFIKYLKSDNYASALSFICGYLMGYSEAMVGGTKDE